MKPAVSPPPAPAPESASGLDAALDLAQSEDLSVAATAERIAGLPGPALVARAAAAGLLVLGAPRRTPLGQVPAASVVSHCASKATCPVVVVPLRGSAT